MTLTPTSSRSSSGGGGGDTIISDSGYIGATQADFDVSGIPATSTHLRIVLYARGTQAANESEVRVQFNGDVGANYDFNHVATFASSVVGGSGVGGTSTRFGSMPAGNAAASRFGAVIAHVPMYSGIANFKPILGSAMDRWSTADADAVLFYFGGLWRSAAAIARVRIFPSAGDFAAGSRLMIYGVS